jgi:hypothetical protein
MFWFLKVFNREICDGMYMVSHNTKYDDYTTQWTLFHHVNELHILLCNE